MNVRISILAVSVLSAVLAGCGGGKFVGRPGLQVVDGDAVPAPLREDLVVPSRPYAIGPGDKLSIVVFGIEDLSKDVTVDLNGNIALPLIGSVEASGKTSDELASAVRDQLRANYVRDPRVAVNIEEAANQVVTVDGSVVKPGMYPVVGQMTLIRAIASASGTTEFAKDDRVVVFRKAGGQQYATLYDLGAIRQGIYADPIIYTNDIVVVGDSQARRLFKDVLSASPLITAPIIALVR